MPAVVIDTNVAVVADGRHEPAGPICVRACVESLEGARKSIVLVDDDYRVLGEYQRQLSGGGQPGAGRAFVQWLWDNLANPRRCRSVAITPTDADESSFIEFPTDAALATFDRSDRKFVAVAVGSGLNPTILNASDSDWWTHREAFLRCGLRIRNICPDLLEPEA